jgi:hypothetical protein
MQAASTLPPSPGGKAHKDTNKSKIYQVSPLSNEQGRCTCYKEAPLEEKQERGCTRLTHNHFYFSYKIKILRK